jgi:hypothetical protein
VKIFLKEVGIIDRNSNVAVYKQLYLMLRILLLTVYAISLGAKGLTLYNQQQNVTFHSPVCILQGKPDKFVPKELFMLSHCLQSHGIP